MPGWDGMAAGAAAASVMDDFRRDPPDDWPHGDVEFTQGLVGSAQMNQHANNCAASYCCSLRNCSVFQNRSRQLVIGAPRSELRELAAEFGGRPLWPAVDSVL